MDEYSITRGGDSTGMRSSRRAFVFGPVAAIACGRRRATGFPGYAFVANSGEQSVAAVDLTSFTVVRQIRLDSAPSAVVAHPERQAVYVVAPQTGTIYEIDAVDLRVKRKLSLKATAVAMRLAPGGAFLWVLCRSPHTLVRVALDKFEAAARLRLPNDPVDFDLSTDGLAAAVVLPEMPAVGLLELGKQGATRVVAAGDDPRAVRFRLDGRQVLVANRSARMLTVLDCKSGATLVRLPLPVEPENFCVKADGGEVYITGKGMDAVVVVYPYRTEIAETRLAGRAPGTMAISRSPEYLFAANPEAGDVTVLEVETGDVLAAVQVGQEPCCITFTPDSQFALVVNHQSGDLAVIRVAAIQPGRNKTAPLFTMIPVGTKPVSAAVV
jgi:YVTN family beta-propeller protein